MRPEEFTPIFRKLALAYGSRLSDDAETLKVYFDILSDLPAELVQAGALEYMSSPSAFPPTPGQIREKAVKLVKRSNRVPSPAEAWGELKTAPVDGITRRSEELDDGWHIYNTPYQFSHPLVEKVARDLGWPGKFWTDNQAADRARFMQAYEVAEDRATEEQTSLPQVQQYVERLGRSDIQELMSGFKREALDRGAGE